MDRHTIRALQAKMVQLPRQVPAIVSRGVDFIPKTKSFVSTEKINSSIGDYYPKESSQKGFISQLNSMKQLPSIFDQYTKVGLDSINIETIPSSNQ